MLPRAGSQEGCVWVQGGHLGPRPGPPRHTQAWRAEAGVARPMAQSGPAPPPFTCPQGARLSRLPGARSDTEATRICNWGGSSPGDTGTTELAARQRASTVSALGDCEPSPPSPGPQTPPSSRALTVRSRRHRPLQGPWVSRLLRVPAPGWASVLAIPKTVPSPGPPGGGAGSQVSRAAPDFSRRQK